MRLFRRGEYMLYEGANPLNSAAFEGNNNVRCLSSSDLLDSRLFGTNVQFLPDLLMKGAKLFVYFDEKQPLGMMCGCKGSCYIRGPGIPLIQSDDTVYWFWIYTLPEARGKNVYTKLKQAFFSFYRDSTLFTALVDPDNTIMCSEMHKLGFVPTRLYSYRKLFTMSLLTRKDMSSNLVKQSLEIGNRRNLLMI